MVTERLTAPDQAAKLSGYWIAEAFALGPERRSPSWRASLRRLSQQRRSRATRHFFVRAGVRASQSARVIPVILAIPMFGDVWCSDASAAVSHGLALCAAVRPALFGSTRATADGTAISAGTVADLIGRGHG